MNDININNEHINQKKPKNQLTKFEYFTLYFFI